MSEEFNEEVEVAEKTQEENFAALRAQNEALLAELRPLRVEKAVTAAGFPVDSQAHKVLSRLATADTDVEAVKSLAEELGFEPPKPGAERTPEQRVIEQQSEIQQRLQSVTTSDEPQDLVQQIADAEAAGDVSLALRLRNRAVLGQPN